jgi:surfeit locus 1 family protein
MKKPPFIPTLIVLAFVVLMTNLGFWQLNRAQEKEELLVLLSDEKITFVNQPEQIKELPQYSNVKFNGQFLNSPQLLLDNQIDNQQIGYHVFTPFLIDNMNLYIMVNRGWIAKERFDMKDISVDTGVIELHGKLNHSPQVGIQLGEIELDATKPSQAITYFDRKVVSKFLYENLCKDLSCIVSDRILLLDKKLNHGFKREWNPVVMPPAKHMGYAVQWFSMTIVLILLFIYWVSKLNRL